MNRPTNTSRDALLYFAPITFLATSVFVIVLAHYIFFEPLLYSADWTHVLSSTTASTYTRDLPWPFQLMPFDVLRGLWRDNVTGFYAALSTIQITMAFLVFLVVREFETLKRHGFPTVVALLFLVYPSDHTKMWLTVLPIHTAALFTLLYGYCLVRFTRGLVAYYVVAIVALCLSFFVYETQLGLVVVWPIILLCCHWRELNGYRRLAIVSPLLMGAAFALWRISSFDIKVSKHDFLTDINVTSWDLIMRLIAGFRVSLVFPWTTTVELLIPIPDQIPSSVLLAVFVLVLFAAARQWSSAPTVRFCANRRVRTAIPYMLCLVVGVILVVGGYVPNVFNYSPNLGGTLSRVNFLASIGAATVVTSALMLGGALFTRSPDHLIRYLIAGAVVTIGLGIASNMIVQRNASSAWNEQKKIYSALMTVAPAFKPRTTVVLVLDGYHEDDSATYHWPRPPISSFWSITEALRYFYNDSTLTGEVLYVNSPSWSHQPRLTAEGLRNGTTGSLIAYSRVAAFHYDFGSGEVSALDSITSNEIPGTSISLPNDLVVPHSASDGERTRILN